MISESGFTLIELLVTMVVATILLALAVPAYNGLIQNNRVTANSNNLANALAVARSEATRRREPVTVCSSTDLQQCSGTPNWETGWIIFNDRTNPGTRDFSSPPQPNDEQLLRVWEAVPLDHTITATGGAAFITFDRLGSATPIDTFRLNNPHCESGQANREREITLTAAGSLHVVRKDCP